MHAPPTSTQTSTTHKPRIRRIAEFRYLIESRSAPGLGRQVDVQTQRCSCPAGRHGRRCYHLSWAQQYHQWRQEQVARSASAPPTPHAPAVPAVSRPTSQPVALSSSFE